MILARPGVGTQSGRIAPRPLNSLPISCWAMSIARPIDSASAGVSTPKIVRTAIFWVRAAISLLMSMRSPPDQVSARSTVQSVIVDAYDFTCLGRTDGCTSERLRRQSGPRATTTPLPITVRKAIPSSGWSKVRSVSVSSSPMQSGSEMNTQLLRPKRQLTMDPYPRSRSKKASGSLPNCGRLPRRGSPFGPGTSEWPRGSASTAAPVSVDMRDSRHLPCGVSELLSVAPSLTGVRT